MSVFRIWKFPLPTDTSVIEVAMPAGFPLSLQLQDGVPCLWAVVLPETAEAGERLPQRFVWVMTGQPVPDEIGVFANAFIGTVQLPSGIVLHLFHLLGGASR